MKVFKDTTGKEWAVNINVTQIKRVRSVLELDLPGLFTDDMQPLAKLLDDPCQLVDVLWVLIRDQANGITDEEFGAAMGGDSLESAGKIFLSELIDFFPQPAKRRNLHKIVGEIQTATDIVQARATASLELLNAETLAEKLMTRLTTVPGSLESTLDRTPSGT